jgi:very-short-patch-repair endonuclease
MLTALYCTASAQFGLITRAQALASGLTPRQIGHRLRMGEWEEVAPGVYRIAGAPIVADTFLAAAVLSTGGAASHRSAAHRLGLVDRLPARPEITIPRTSSFRGAVDVHRPLDFTESDVAVVDRIRCTTPSRTLVDLGAVCSRNVVEIALHRVLRQNLVPFDDIVTQYFALARSGRSGCRSLGAVLFEYDPTMPPPDSKLESVLLRILRNAGLPAPTRQHKVTCCHEDFRIDVSYPEHRIAIEGDGFGVHIERRQFERDRARQNLLVLDGWLILRFTWRQLHGQPIHVAPQVRTALSQSRGGL